MKSITLLFLLLPGLLHSDDTWRKDRPVPTFTGLRVSSGIDVFLSQGNAEKLTFDVKGVEEDEVRSEVRNGILFLTIDRKGSMLFNFGRNRYVKAYVTVKQLTELKAGGGSDVLSEGSLSFRNLNLDASGGSDVKLNLKADELNVAASGGADVILQGSVRKLNADGSGGSELDARKLTAEICNARSTGGSDVYVNATKEISMRATGGSDLYYYGPAKVLAKSESGGSDITRRD
ncbi:hypothetical protein BN8_04030 [Fibrisoma limi BUZ 3]|uniref:Putative auto-transporter adhesin head GIN domain-containing protein n=1 Tax=Fibrisoma limi BUZ 3 TaxID=1185876 RepID=I2GLP7_9BACT|nr:head GIN domain-containing protein [Fibrisoma limi]CCH54823.1 hypothetical protein BN8_04030 [Fibrisoma limi BUZ 3]